MARQLEEQLKRQREQFAEKAPEAVQQTMHDALERLKASDITDNAIKTGDTAPPFTLSNAAGNPVSLGARLLDGPVVLTFYRGNW